MQVEHGLHVVYSILPEVRRCFGWDVYEQFFRDVILLSEKAGLVLPEENA